MFCLFPSLCGPQVVQNMSSGHLLDSSGKLSEGLNTALGPCHQLIVVCCDKILVPKAVLKGLDDFIHSFQDSV